MNNTSVKAKRGRQSKKNALQRKLFAAKAQVKELTASPNAMFKYFGMLGITLQPEEVITFLKMQFSAIRKHRLIEEPVYYQDSETGKVYMTYLSDNLRITLYLKEQVVRYEPCGKPAISNTIIESGLLQRILREMPI